MQFLSKLSTCSASRHFNWKLKSGMIQGTIKNMRWGLKIAGVTVVSLLIWYAQYVMHQILINSTCGCHFATPIIIYEMLLHDGNVWMKQSRWESVENSNSNQQHMAGNLPTWSCALLRVWHIPLNVSLIDR